MREADFNIQNDEIDLKEIFRTIYRYKFSILFFIVVAVLASGVVAYFKPNIYQVSATVEVGEGQSKLSSSQDILTMAMAGESVNVDTEMEIVKSRFLVQKAAKEVDIAHHYYTKHNYKQVELYKNTPFKVGVNRGYGVEFDVYPIDDFSYYLVVDDAKDKYGNKWSYKAQHEYGKEVSTEYFHINVARVGDMKEPEYSFVVYDPIQSAQKAQENLSVSQTSKASSVLKILFEDNVAERAKEFTNALASAYIEQSIENKTEEAEKKLAFIDEQLESIQGTLKNAAMKVEEFKRKSNTVELSTKAEQAIQKIGDYESQLSMIKIQEELLNTLYKNLRRGEDIESVSVANLGAAGQSLSEMIQKLQETTIKKKILREDYTEMYPEVVKLTSTITSLKKTIIATVKNMQKTTKEKREILSNSLKEYQAIIDKLPTDQRMYGELERKFVVNEKIYSYLLEKRSETAMLKAATVSNNRIIDHAIDPDEPIKPKRKLIVVVGFVLGLILGIAYAFLREFLDNTIKSEEDLEHKTDLPILGSVPAIGKVQPGEIKIFDAPKSVVSESFRNIRTNLQFLSHGKETLVVAITSTISREGKTTTSINLASILSLSQKKTIIINTDMRKPTLHERFGIELGQGLSSYLAGHIELGEVIQSSGYENMDVITSGPIPPNPSELIQGKRMQELLEKLKQEYDVVILDTPPVGLVTDARILMQQADVNIYMVRANYSKKEFLNNLKKVTEFEDVSGLCLVLNDVKKGSSYGYGYGYGYYAEDK